MPHDDTVEVKNNLALTLRERGKVIDRREGHNIWLHLGSEYLASLMSCTSFDPFVPERDDRIRYMGFGIGGTRQTAPAVANAPPLLTAYPGGNTQRDTDPTILRLERPVRVSGSSDPYPGQAADVWLGQIQAPVEHSGPRQRTYRRIFQRLEVSYGPFLTLPLSEIALFTSAVSRNTHNNTAIAYDTFDPLSKTTAFELEVAWTVRL